MILNKLEVLRYLGYNKQNIDFSIEKVLDECIHETSLISQKLFVYNTYDIEKSNQQVSVKDTTLSMSSKDLTSHLAQSDRCTLMATSLGLEIDRRIAYYAKFNITKSLILDACASTAIEILCDDITLQVKKEASAQGYHITNRFSPGYGDLPLSLQKEFAQVLNTYTKIGLTVNESSIMLPRKSVTAIIGWQKEPCLKASDQCKLCLKKDCPYRKRGDKNE